MSAATFDLARFDPGLDADVVVLGGGLAGLSLALQLRGEHPGLRIDVIERRRHPVPEAAFKIGESSVEIAAQYFARTLGLKDHLDGEQIKKFGFRFFFSDGRRDLDRCPELGASMALATGSWQIDRGRFENMLGERAAAAGIGFHDGAVVRGIALAEDDDAPHVIRFERDGAERALRTRWVVDASGRAGLLKRQLGLAEDNGHVANAVWFRVKGRLDPQDWSKDAAWRERCSPPERWRSTNHLVGPGYWVWLIPLASGAHSVGIVCDAATHPIEGMNTLERALDWLRVHQPRLAEALEPMRDEVMDFAFFKRFSYGCKQLFSPRRWAMAGEAGVFLDPFYSPGSDFIAIANTYITRLVGKDLAGEAWQPYAGVYEQLFLSFYGSTMAMYRGQYHLFGDPGVMPLKVLWDYTYYWGVLAALFFAGRIADLPTLSRLKPELAEAKALNAAMQALLGAWGRRRAAAGALEARPAPEAMLDQAALGWFAELNRALVDELDDAAFRARMRANLRHLRSLAGDLARRALAADPALADGLDLGALAPLLADDHADAGLTPLPAAWWNALDPAAAPLATEA